MTEERIDQTRPVTVTRSSSPEPLSRVVVTNEVATKMAVAVISYDTREQLAACLATIDPHQGSREVVVVDNGSQDGSVEMVRARFPWVTLRVSPSNRGYGSAANQAFALCRADYVLLLNSDTLLADGTVPALASYLDGHPRVGIVGPRLLNPDRSLQCSCYPFPSPLNELLRWTSLGVVVGHLPGLRERYLPTSSHRFARPADWVVGAALAIRRKAFETVGGFDESFFMYSEEVDLCYRLRQAGWETHFAPVTEVVHMGGASTARYRGAMAAQLFASLEQFYRRHYPHSRRLGLKLVLTYLMLRNVAQGYLHGRSRSDTEHTGVAEDMAAWRRVLAEVWRRW